MKRIQRQILRESNLRLTTSRSSILALFLNSAHALSYADIEKEVGSTFDRVTIYRTIKSFLEKGIVHKILDDTGAPTYGLCSEYCSQAQHQHDHVHFKCNLCGQTICLDEIDIPEVALPNGYKPREVNLLIQGVCSDCG